MSDTIFNRILAPIIILSVIVTLIAVIHHNYELTMYEEFCEFKVGQFASSKKDQSNFEVLQVSDRYGDDCIYFVRDVETKETSYMFGKELK